MSFLQNNYTLQNGKYRIEKVLGQGGFGITYLAKQVVQIEGPLGKINAEIDVAIKEFFIKDMCCRDENSSWVTIPSTGNASTIERFRQKFIKEAHNISRLNHPNIIKVLEVFEENGTAYYVMEYINGGSLSSLIANRGQLSEATTLLYTKRIADALKYIHSVNMNHLDIKPANVLVRNNGDIVLIDFGLSKNYDASGEQTTSTPVGVSVGYAPIEQSRIEGLGVFSPETDIYALGATMFKMLTGQTPPEASVVFDDGLPDLPANVSENLSIAITKAMEPRRKDRFHSIDELLLQLNANTTLPALQDSYIKQQHIQVPTHPNNANTGIPATSNHEEAPLFIKNEENEATRIISVDMVKASTISNADEAVDLGLSVKWCSHNLGATKPEDFGSFYEWNNGEPIKGVFKQDIAGTDLDIATQLLGSKWRMPTKQHFKELIDKCRWTWTEYKGVKGCKITGCTGKSIFLPASGKLIGKIQYLPNKYGYYWSASKAQNINTAYYLFFNEEDYDISNEIISSMRTIRPICD